MAFLMTDMAAGSTAARNLQQNIYGAQYDEANIAAAAEQNQLKLQQDRIKTMYAPEEAQLKLEQDRLGNEKTKLANLVTDTNFKASEDSKAKLKALAQTEEFQKADDAERLRLSAAVQFQNADIKNGTETLAASELYVARNLANKQKVLDQNAQEMGNAFAVVDALKTPEQQAAFFTEMQTQQPEQYQNLIKQIGPSTFEKMTTEEKHGALKGLMFNAKGQLSSQLKQIEVEKQILINESYERRARIREDGRLNVKLAGGGTEREMRDWNLYNKAVEGIEKSGRKTLDKLTEAVDAADLAQEKSKVTGWYRPDRKKPTEETELVYKKAVEARDNFQRSQLKKQIDVTATAPDFPGKAAILKNMNTELELYGPAPKTKTPPPKDDGKGTLPPPATQSNQSLRPDGSPKGTGFLGVLKASDGSDVTEYSMSAGDVTVNGKEIDFPTIVPTLTKEELNLMLTDIIPNNKRIPDAIVNKAIDHANKRIKEGKSVFADKTSTSATSNKPPAKLTPVNKQNSAAIDKANEAIQKGADPAEVKARLKKAGVSFKE